MIFGFGHTREVGVWERFSKPLSHPLHVEVYGSYSESSRRSSKESNVLYIMRPSVEAVQKIKDPSLDAVDGGGSPLDTGFTLRRLTDRERVKSF
jgi:hypothetical protein